MIRSQIPILLKGPFVRIPTTTFTRNYAKRVKTSSKTPPPIQKGKLQDEDDLSLESFKSLKSKPATSTRTSKRPPPTQKGKLEEDGDLSLESLRSLKSKPTTSQIIESEEQANNREGDAEKFRPWLKTFLFAHSKDTPDQKFKRMVDLSKPFLKHVNVSADPHPLGKNFSFALQPHLTEFGDTFLKDAIKNDEGFEDIYDEENPTIAYLLAAEQLSRGFTDSEVMEDRLAADRFDPLSIEQQEAVENFSSELEKVLDTAEIKAGEQSGLEASDLIDLIYCYNKIPSDKRSRCIDPDDLETFLEVIIGNLELVGLKTADEVFSDLINSELPLTLAELGCWLNIQLDLIGDFTPNVYGEAKKHIRQAGYDITVELYNTFLERALNCSHHSLFKSILKDMEDDKLYPNRSTFILMTSYCGETGNLTALLNLVALRTNGRFSQCFEVEDFRVMYEAFLKVNEHEFAKDLLTTVVIIRESYREYNGFDIDDDELQTTYHQLPVERPLDIFDLVAQRQRVLEYYPQLTAEMLEPFYEYLESIKELKELDKISQDEHIMKTPACIASTFKYLHKTVEKLEFKDFQDVVLEIIENERNYLADFITSEESLKHFCKIAEHYTSTSVIDGNDDLKVEAFKTLWDYLADFQHLGNLEDYDEDAQVYRDVIGAVLELSGLQDKYEFYTPDS